ncbi:hypothetical protein [Sinorhizobium meliloti]|uniref:hypothetical protein n=1 Tax=Rhizobium meliloti TaxID=382 RepID=UPI0013E3FA91|nr:hypothetical protein [Sinorhizobium meliloti]
MDYDGAEPEEKPVSRQAEACSEAGADEGRCGMTDPAEMIAWLDRPPFKKSLVLKRRLRPRKTTSPDSKRSAARI